MIEYSIYLNIPKLESPDISIAKYSFDPGLQVGDIVNVANLEWNKITGNMERWLKVEKGVEYSFEAMVTMRKYLIDAKNSTFKVQIRLEMADKEKLPELAEVIEHNSKHAT